MTIISGSGIPKQNEQTHFDRVGSADKMSPLIILYRQSQEFIQEIQSDPFGSYDDSIDDESNFYASDLDQDVVSNDLMAMSVKTKKHLKNKSHISLRRLEISVEKRIRQKK